MIGHALPILSLVRVLKNLNELNFGLNTPGEVFRLTDKVHFKFSIR